jgi:hypothetical protein
MPKLMKSLAALLSLAMAATSVSASTCDLFCCLHPAHSDSRAVSPLAACHHSGATSKPLDAKVPPHQCGSTRGEARGSEPKVIFAADVSWDSVSSVLVNRVGTLEPARLLTNEMDGRSWTVMACHEDACGRTSSAEVPSQSLQFSPLLFLSHADAAVGLLAPLSPDQIHPNRNTSEQSSAAVPLRI